MAEAHIQTEQTPAQTPLLDPEQTQEEVEKDTQLDQALQRLETVLCFLGFHQSSLLSILFSWFIFLLVGVSISVVALQISRCSDCERYQINKFELHILVSEACLAAVSLLCVSHNLRKYGIRKFLFVDRYHGHMSRFRKEYIKKIEDFFCLLVLWMLPCFLLKTAREVIRAIYVRHESWWQSVAIFLALVVSWTYLTTIFLSACLLFSLVCNLQIIHFEDYGMLLERNHDVSVFIEEHIRLRHHLSKISHRFRIYLLLAFLVVTASQFVTLLQTTGYHGISFINGGDFAVSSIVQVVGIVLCLHAAAKISHRAQGIASVASQWHALFTCSSTDASQLRVSNSMGNLEASNQVSHRAQGIASVASQWHALFTCSSTDASQLRVSNSMGNLEASNQVGSISINYSESDLESVDYLPFPTNSQLASYMSTYQKRQAFVLYLQSNPGGVTIFGWTVDRALINTIFFIELSLVLFVLGKTIVFTTK